jgi:hypothetical protein
MHYKFIHGREYQRRHDLPLAGSAFIPIRRRSVKCGLCRLCRKNPTLEGGILTMTERYTVAVVEVGEDYTERLQAIKVDHCSLDQAQQIVKDLGYRVIPECCTIVHTADEIHIIVAVEPKKEEEE